MDVRIRNFMDGLHRLLGICILLGCTMKDFNNFLLDEEFDPTSSQTGGTIDVGDHVTVKSKFHPLHHKRVEVVGKSSDGMDVRVKYNDQEYHVHPKEVTHQI